MSNLLAAVGRGQLANLPGKVARRRAINAAYREAFAEVEGIDFMPNAAGGEPTNWLTVVTIDEARVRRVAHRGPRAPRVARHRGPARVEAHAPAAACSPRTRAGVVRVAEEIFRTGLCLPSGSAMTDSDIERVVDASSPPRP